MVGIVSSNELGLLGGAPGIAGGHAGLGRAGEQVFVNVATGNVIVQRQDDVLLGQGPDISLARTYNSQGRMSDDNGDNWRLGIQRRIDGLTGALNAAGSTVRRTDADGAELVYAYDVARAMYVNHDGAGSTDTLAFDSRTSQWTWTDGDSRVSETYDWNGSAGKLLTLTDTDGNALAYRYTGALLTSVADASGEITYLDYAGTNLVAIRTITADGTTHTRVRYGYDASGRLSSVTLDLTPDDNSIADGKVYITTYTYDGASTRLAGMVQSDGSQLDFAYAMQADGSTRLTEIRQNMGAGSRITRIAYDLANRSTSVTDPAGNRTIHAYDAQGRLTSLTGPAIAGASQRIAYTYDGQGNIATSTDALGHTTQYEYDANDNLTLQRDAAGNTVSRTYGGQNELLTQTVYPAVGQSQTMRYAYDSRGHVRFAVSAQGRVTEYRYNALGQQVAVIAYAANVLDLTGLTVNATITESDLAAWASRADQSRSLRTDTRYDFRGQVAAQTRYASVDSTGAGVADGTASVTCTVYDQAGLLLNTVAPNGAATAAAGDFVTTYRYDGMGRVTGSTDTLGNVSVTAYDDAGNTTRTTLANGLATTSVYNRAGELVSVLQADGATAPGVSSFRYDADGRLRMTQDPTGIRTFMLYDEAGRKVADIDGNGSLTEYRYNANGQIIQTIRYASPVSMAALLDADGNPADPGLNAIRPAAAAADRRTRNLYDAANRLVKTVDELGFVSEIIYDGASRVSATIRYATAIDAGALTDASTTDSVSPLANAADRRTRTLYDNDGNVVAVLDADGYLTGNEYDAAGRLVHSIAWATPTDSAQRASGTLAQLRPAGSAQDSHRWTLHDGQSRVIASIDGEGYLTETMYDANGNPVQQIRYANKTRIAPDAITFATVIGQLRPLASVQDQSTTRTFTQANQVATEIDAQGSVTRFTYDSSGQLVRTDRAFGTGEVRTLQARHDRLGQLTGELTAEGSAALAALLAPTPAQIDALWAQYGVSHTYDQAGRRTASTDANGNRSLFYYDSGDGALTCTINGAGEVTRHDYNALNQQVRTVQYGTRIDAATLATLTGGLLSAQVISLLNRVAGAADSTVTVAYDLRGQVASSIDALGAVTSIAYNAFGDVRSTTGTIDAGHTVTTRYQLNQRGLVTQTTEDDGGLNRITRQVFDAFGRVTQSTDGNGRTHSWQYDRRGRIVQSTDALDVRRTSSYDAFDRVLTQTDGNGNTTTTRYDAATRSITVTTAEGIAVTTTRNRHGETVLFRDGNGNTTSYAYDRNGKLTRTSHDALAITGSSQFDHAGQLAESTDANGVRTVYQYDAANRLLRRTVDPAGLNLQTTYVYDAKGQVLSVTDPAGVVTATTYDKKGQALTVTVDPAGLNLVTAYAYDARGKMLSVTEGAGSSAPRITQYSYDKLGRRTAQAVDSGGLAITTGYGYDGNDNLVRKTDANGNVTRYFHDGDNRLVYALDASNGVVGNTYDGEGRVVETTAYAHALTDPGATPTTADIAGKIRADAADRVTRTVFDKDGRAIFSIDALGGVTRNVYDANGNALETIAYAKPVAASTPWTVAGVTAALAPDVNADHHVRIVRDAANRPLYSIDASGAVTQNNYDRAGNVVRTVQHANAVTLAGQPDAAAVAAALHPDAGLDRVTRTVFDAAGRPVYRIDGSGYVTETRYDQVGRIVETIVHGMPVHVGDVPSVADVIAALQGDIVAASVVNATTTTWTDPVQPYVYDGVTSAAAPTQPYVYSATATEDTVVPAKRVVLTAGSPTPSADLGFFIPTFPGVGNGKIVSWDAAVQPAGTTVRFTYRAFGGIAVFAPAAVTLVNGRQQVSMPAAGNFDYRIGYYDSRGQLVRFATGRLDVPSDAMSWPGMSPMTTDADFYDVQGQRIMLAVDSTARVVTWDASVAPAGSTVRFAYRATGRTGAFTIAGTTVASGRQQVSIAGLAVGNYDYRIEYCDSNGQVLQSASDCFTVAAGGRSNVESDLLPTPPGATVPLTVANSVTPQGTQVANLLRWPATVQPPGTSATYRLLMQDYRNVVCTSGAVAAADGSQQVVLPDFSAYYAIDGKNNYIFCVDYRNSSGEIVRHGEGAIRITASGAEVLSPLQFTYNKIASTVVTGSSISGYLSAEQTAAVDHIEAVVRDAATDVIVSTALTYPAHEAGYNGRINLRAGSVLPDGRYRITITLHQKNGTVVTRPAFAYEVNAQPALPPAQGSGSSINAYIPVANAADIDHIDATVIDRSNGWVASTATTNPGAIPGYGGQVNLKTGGQLANGSYTVSIVVHFKDGAVARHPTFTYEIGRQPHTARNTTVAWSAANQPADSIAQFSYSPAGFGTAASAPVALAAGQNQVTLANLDDGAYSYTVCYIDRSTGLLIKQASGQFTAAANGSATAPLTFETDPGAVLLDRSNRFRYDAAGRLIASTDAEGLTERYRYDALGNKTAFTNKKGAVWTYDYDALGRLLAEHSPQVAVTTVNENLIVTVQTASLETRYVYDALGHILSYTEAHGRPEARTTQYRYDALGRQVQTIFPQVRIDEAASDSANPFAPQLTTEATPPPPPATDTMHHMEAGVASKGAATPRPPGVELTSRVTYDTLGNAVVNLDVAGNYSYKVYDRLGRVQYSIDAEQYVTEYTYDGFGQQVRLTRHANRIDTASRGNPNAAFTSAEVARLLGSPAAGDRTIVTEYNRLGQVARIIEPQAAAYDAGADASHQYFSAGRITRNTYNAYGQLVRQGVLVNPTTDAWAETTYYYDARGNKIAQVDPLGYLSTWQYDAADNVTRQVDYALALKPGTWSTVSYGQPVETLPSAAADSAVGYDRETRFVYDRKNQKVEEIRVHAEYATLPGNLSVAGAFGDLHTRYAYNGVGNMIRMTDAGGGAILTYYDVLGRTTALVSPAGDSQAGLTVFDRDAYGNLTRQIRYANGTTRADDNGYTDPVVSTDDQVSYNLFDTHGHQTLAVDAEGNAKYYGYDAMGHIVKEWQPIRDVDGKVQTALRVFKFDKLGQQVATIDPGYLPNAALAPAATPITLMPRGVTFAVTQSANWASTEDGLTWIGSNQVKLAWNPMGDWGSGAVTVTIDYLTPLVTYSDESGTHTVGGLARSYTQTVPADSADTGTLLSWAESSRNSDGGIGSILRVQVAKADAGGTVREIHNSTVSGATGTLLTWTRPPQDGLQTQLLYRPSTGGAWRPASIYFMGKQYVFDGSILPAGSYEFEILYTRPGESAPSSNATGSFTVDGSSGSISNRKFNFGGSYTVPGLNPADVVTSQVRYNAFGEIVAKGVNGWQEYADYDNAGHMWRANGKDGIDRVYLYDLQGRATAEIHSAGRNLHTEVSKAEEAAALTTDIARTNTVYDADGRVVQRVLPSFALDRNIEVSPALLTNPAATLSFSIASTAAYGSSESGYGWQGDNAIQLNWSPMADWGNGRVRVEVTYVAGVMTFYDESGTHVQGGAVTTRSETFAAANADAGVVMRWTDADALAGGIGSIKSVRVYKEGFDGKEVLIHERANSGAYARQLLIPTPTELGGGLELRYRRTGTDGWTGATLLNFGRQTLVRLSGIAPGEYEYEVLYYHKDASGTTAQATPYAHATGKFSIAGTAGTLTQTTATGADPLSVITPVIRQTVDRWGNVLSVSNPGDMAVLTRYRYNGLNQVLQETRPMVDVYGTDGKSLRMAPKTYTYYDKLGRTIATVDANGNVSTLRSNSAGQVTAEYHPDGGVVRYTYDLLGRKTAMTDANGKLTRYRYDRLDRLLRQERLLGAETYQYDAAGNRILQVNAAGEQEKAWYDTRGKVIRTRVDMGQESNLYYDARGNKVKELNANGDIAIWRYDAFGRMLSHTDLGGQAFTQIYDNAGQLIRKTSTGGQDQSYRYYANGALQSINDAALNAQTYYEYDAAGNRTRERFRTGAVTHQDNRIRYDALGRITRVDDNRYLLTYGYDANGNRRFNKSAYYEATGTSKNVENWYAYDGMNRITISQGAPGTLVTSAQGTRLEYDAAGNRTVATYYRGASMPRVTREVYRYDDQNRLLTMTRDGVEESSRTYDMAGRLTVQISNADGSYQRRVNTYNRNGWLKQRDTLDRDGVLQTVVRYTGFDQLGNVTAYQIEVKTGTQYTNKYSYEYARYDTYKEKVVHGSSSYFQPGDTTSTYDVNGNLTAVSDRFNANNNRSFVNDQYGHILSKTENGLTSYNFYVNDKPSGSTGAAGIADFDFNYTPISDQYPAGTPGKYVVSQGETLRSIAQAAYGDAQLWYLIADANGLKTDADLRVGQNLTIPNKITNLHNDFSTFKPYAPGAIVGDTTPTLPAPPPPPVHQYYDDGCGVVGIIIMVVVTIVVAYYATEYLSELGPLWSAVLGGMIGSAAGQMVGMALGVQEDFSWKAVALAGLSAGVTQGLGGGSADPWVRAAQAAGGSVVTQGIAVVTGLQEKFDWRAVAASAVAAGVGFSVSEQMGSAAQGAVTNADRIARYIVTGVASSVVRQLVSGGKMNWTEVATDAFGNALRSNFEYQYGVRPMGGTEVAGTGVNYGEEQPPSVWSAQKQAVVDRAVAGQGYSEEDYWNSAARTTGDQYADRYGGEVLNTGDRLRLSSASANGVDAKDAGVLNDSELGRLQARELDLIAQNIQLKNSLAEQREQDYIANSDYREGRRLENLNVGASPIYTGYDELGILTNPEAAPISNSFGRPLARALSNTVEGMHNFKYGAMSSIDIEAELAAQAGDDAALRSAGIRHTVLDLMLPGSPQEVGLGVAGGAVIGKAAGWAGSTITRLAAESSNFQFLTRDIGEAVGEYASGLWSRVGSEFAADSLEAAAIHPGRLAAESVEVSQASLLRALRQADTPESLATAKLISRGKLEVNILDVDPSGRGLGGLYRFGTKEIDIYGNAFSTPTQAAGYATHESTHFMQGLTRSNYNLGHEFDAFRAQGAVDLGHWANGLSDLRLFDLLGTHPVYRGVRPAPNWPH